MKRTISIIVAAFVMLAFSFTLNAGEVSAKTIKYKEYADCYKIGKYVYCGNRCSSLYKVNLKTKKAKKIKGIYKRFHGAAYMKYYKGYLYFNMLSNGGRGPLFRTNVKTNKVQALAKEIGCFTVSNNKIYVTVWSNSSNKDITVSMNLNGKNKKKTSYKLRFTKLATTNAKGYKTVDENLGYRNIGDEDNPFYIPNKAKMYLKTPNKGKIYICTYDPSINN